MIGTFKFKSNVPEQEFMESVLNMTASGYDMSLGLSFYALGESMHIDDFLYYKVLIDEVGRTLMPPIVTKEEEK